MEGEQGRGSTGRLGRWGNPPPVAQRPLLSVLAFDRGTGQSAKLLTALAARLGATPAVVLFVLVALGTAGVADLRAKPADLLGATGTHLAAPLALVVSRAAASYGGWVRSRAVGDEDRNSCANALAEPGHRPGKRPCRQTRDCWGSRYLGQNPTVPAGVPRSREGVAESRYQNHRAGW
jgi:hypothetical protein